jgi:acylpyruvate hydrolase
VRLATIRTAAGTRAVRIDGDRAVETGDADVRAVLDRPDWGTHAASAAGPTHPVEGLDYAPLVPVPEKIICVGQNYADHIAEMGHEPPAYPTIFAKFPPALIGAYDDIVLPTVSQAVDYEAELVVVIGRPVRHATREQVEAAVAGYTIMNDVSVRDYQMRTSQFLQGKTFEHTTPLGPWLVTPDELPAGGWEISTTIDGEVRQHSDTGQLVFGVVDLVVYLSTILTLKPGDVIATGTPGGVGHARKPPRYLTDGATMVTEIAGIGRCRNVCRAEKASGEGGPAGTHP